MQTNKIVSFASSTLFCLFVASSEASTVLVTKQAAVTQWTCFDVDNSDECCEAIHAANEALGDGFMPNDPTCLSQLADIPQSLSLPSLASYSLIHFETGYIDPTSDIEVSKQHIWSDNNYPTIQLLEEPSSPFILRSSQPSPSVNIKSDLSDSGGMHRLFRHRIETPSDIEITYLFLTVSRDLFVDLDDAYDGGSNVVVVHSARVCDIEQPSFVSGQHVIVFEINSSDNLSSSSELLNLSSKVHLRYPYPSSDYQLWIELLMPQVLCRSRNQRILSESAYLKVNASQRIWSAAGSDDDYEVVMWSTIVACLLGVGWMLAGILHVSQWDP